MRNNLQSRKGAAGNGLPLDCVFALFIFQRVNCAVFNPGTMQSRSRRRVYSRWSHGWLVLSMPP